MSDLIGMDGIRAFYPAARAGLAKRTFHVALGAVVVALSAQVTVPVPLSPVPMTLQPLAVLAAGGVLGARAGAAALVLYLALGLLGLPVFAGGSGGLLHVLGPTGGYLLAFPAAAGLTGLVTDRLRYAAPSKRILGVLLGCALGMAVIHAGGVAQLAALGRSPSLAFRVGFLPFLTGDLLKVGLAAVAILVASFRRDAAR